MRRSRLGLALAALGATLLAGCAGIPTSGQVVRHDEIDAEDRVVPYVGGEVQGPQPGQTPEEIVNGFLEAMNFYEANYATAREYLTTEASRGWHPDVYTTIYSAEPTTEEAAQSRVRVELNVWATVEAQREYERAAPGTVQEYHLQLAQVGGEWRIATPPPGLIIRDADFNDEFAAHDLYFFEPGFDALVPDTVYLPVRGAVPTLLAQKLLAGPSEWLAPAVRTAFPEGTRLAVDAVAVTGGEADVKLTEDALRGDQAERDQMVRQLSWTLGQLSGIDHVKVHGGQVVLDEEQARTFPESDPAHAGAMDLFAVTDAGVVRLDDTDAASPVPGPLGEHPGVEEVAVDLTMNAAVVVDEARTTLKWSQLADDANLEIIVQGERLRSPSIDRHGLVWVIRGEGESSELVVSSSAAEQVVVPINGLNGRRLDAVAVAADGTRIALVAEGEVYFGIVLRTEWPREMRVEHLRPIEHSDVAGSAIDVTWSQFDQIAVLTGADEDSGRRQRAWVFTLSGRVPSSPAGVVDGAETLTANWRESRKLAAGGIDQVQVQEPPTLNWAQIPGIRRPAYPG